MNHMTKKTKQTLEGLDRYLAENSKPLTKQPGEWTIKEYCTGSGYSPKQAESRLESDEAIGKIYRRRGISENNKSCWIYGYNQKQP